MNSIVAIALLLFLLLSLLNPFAGLSTLLLILVGFLLYNFVLTLIRAFITASEPPANGKTG